jgi:hypothetical protein
VGRAQETNRWRCNVCKHVADYSSLLRAPSPFDPEEVLFGCMQCKQCVEGFVLLCDELGCNKHVSCGWPTGNIDDSWDGYRNTCSDHMRTT